MYSTVLLYRLHLLYEIVPYYGLESCKLPHVLLHFNAFKVSEFNIKNEKCAGRFYLMGICPLCFLVKTLHQEWDFRRVEIKEFENSYWWVVILLLSRNHERSFPVHPEWEVNSAHCFCNGLICKSLERMIHVKRSPWRGHYDIKTMTKQISMQIYRDYITTSRRWQM